jgi:hypothetical protein
MPPVPQAPEGAEAPVEGAAPATPEITETTAPPPPAPDFDRIYERMDEMSAQQQRIAEQLGQVGERIPAPEEELPEFYDETGELTEDGVRAVVNDYVNEQIEARMAPREAQQLTEQRDEEWEALKESVPEFADAKYAQEVIGQAAAWAHAHNPGLIDRPEFVDVIEWVHKVRKYDESAAAQTPAGPGVVLESAQGAAQPSKGSDVDWSDRIVKAAERLRPQI